MNTIKTTFPLCGLLLTAMAGWAQQPFTVKGHITGSNARYIYLSYWEGKGKQVKDSAKITQGTFLFKGTLSSPVTAYLYTAATPDFRDRTSIREFMLEPSNITVTISGRDLQQASVKGSVTEDEKKALEGQTAGIRKEMEALSKKYEKDSDAYRKAVTAGKSEHALDSMKEALNALHEQFEPYNERIKKVTLDFIATHPNSYLSPMQLRFYVAGLPLDSLKLLYNGLSQPVKESSTGKEIAEEIRRIVAGSPGSPAADFSAKDIHGQPLQLSSFRGQYVLIDFWASWCVPCRHGNPHLLELYKKYHDKGFTIIGVADDDSKPQEWHKAVEKDGIGIWHHVLRGLDWEKLRKGEKNEKDISEKYGISSLPTKILVDKTGTIIGRYGEGRDDEAALDQQLATLLP